eukprot:1727669-Rhodomonas_salina.2
MGGGCAGGGCKQGARAHGVGVVRGHVCCAPASLPQDRARLTHSPVSPSPSPSADNGGPETEVEHCVMRLARDTLRAARVPTVSLPRSLARLPPTGPTTWPGSCARRCSACGRRRS